MLSQTALIVFPTIQSTTLKVTDKQAGKDLAHSKRATEKSTRVVKALINTDYLKPISQVMTAFRTYMQSQTVPWYGDSCLLPKDKLFDFSAKVTEYQDELDKEVNRFIRSYSSLINEAAQELGDMFNSEDYPDPMELKGKFSLGVKFVPVSDSNKFSDLGFDDTSTDRLRAAAIEAENKLLKEATENLFERVKLRVQMLANRFKDPLTKRYHQSLVDGLEVLVDTLPSLNITGDPGLSNVIDDVRQMIASFDFDEAKEKPEVREDVAAQCDAILAKIGAFL